MNGTNFVGGISQAFTLAEFIVQQVIKDMDASFERIQAVAEELGKTMPAGTIESAVRQDAKDPNKITIQYQVLPYPYHAVKFVTVDFTYSPDILFK